MHPEFDQLTYPENGPRYTVEGSLDGAQVLVATGYSGSTDSWPYHVYVELPNGEKHRLTEGSGASANTKDEARYAGLQIAANFIRRRAGGFQKVVQ